MSTDEAKDNGTVRSGELQLAFPLHTRFQWNTSMVEVTSGDDTLYDPKTAHEAAGDGLGEKRLPKSCFICAATELAEEAARFQEKED